MEFLGYIGSVLIGISLGLIGSGGSILTVPVLVYLFRIDAVLATGYSLFIVGVSSLIGSISYFLKGLVNIRTAVVFGIPSIIAVFYTRAKIIPAIPPEILNIGDFTLTKSVFLLVLFALLMIPASYRMIKSTSPSDAVEIKKEQVFNYPLILLEGIVVGVLTGMVGAGGGFLIIPALVLLSRLPMKEAVGTSLIIIAVKSIVGFLGESEISASDWKIILGVLAFAILGIFIGSALSTKIDGKKLKPAFGWFVLIMGVYILIKELLM